MLLRARREDRHRARPRGSRGHARKGQWRGIDLPFLQLGLLSGRRRAARDTRTASAGRDVTPSGQQRTYEAILSGNARARSVEPCGGPTSSSVVDLETEAVAKAILLGRLRPPGRVEIAPGASISQKNGRAISPSAT